MYTKAVFVDFKPDEIEKKYMERITPLFQKIEFVTFGDSFFVPMVKDTEVIFCKISTKIDKEIIDSAPKLKYIGVLSTAFDAIDVKYAQSKGIAVCNLGGYSTEAVAEFVFAAL